MKRTSKTSRVVHFANGIKTMLPILIRNSLNNFYNVIKKQVSSKILGASLLNHEIRVAGRKVTF